MIRTGKHKQLAVALNLQKFYFGFKTIVQSFSSMASSNPSLWISKPYEMIRFLHTYGHYHNFRFVSPIISHARRIFQLANHSGNADILHCRCDLPP